jgi:hypothetical protein
VAAAHAILGGSRRAPPTDPRSHREGEAPCTTGHRQPATRRTSSVCARRPSGAASRAVSSSSARWCSVSRPAPWALVGACGDEGEPRRRHAVSVPPMDETKPEEITLYNWTDYMDPDIRKDFKAGRGHQGQRVVLREQRGAARQAARRLDRLRHHRAVRLHVPDHDQERAAAAARHDSYIPNFEVSTSRLKAPSFDNPADNGGVKYSVPYFYGTTGYCVRTDKVSPTPTDWTAALRPGQRRPDPDARRRARVSRRRSQVARLLLQHERPGPARRGHRQAHRAEAAGQHLRLGQHEARDRPGRALRHVLGRRRADGHRRAGRRGLPGHGGGYVLPSEGFVRWTDAMSDPQPRPRAATARTSS